MNTYLVTVVTNSKQLNYIVNAETSVTASELVGDKVKKYNYMSVEFVDTSKSGIVLLPNQELI